VTTRTVTPGRPGIKGHLRLVCAVDEAGRSYLKKQSFCVPFHLSKTFQENGVLVANVANPTAGLFCGDTTRCDVRVESGARLLLTTPSATRIHNTLGGTSDAVQEFSVQANGWLEILPELIIPQQGARHRQRTRIDVEPSGELIFLETLAPGRVASGEIFAFDELDWQTEIRFGGRLIARERFILSPQNKSLSALKTFSTQTYLATFFVITERLNQASLCWNEIGALNSEGLWIGSSRLVAGGWVIKILACDSNRLRQTVSAVREKLHRDAGWPLPLARKL
jgi:urease accessory protein